MHPMTDHAADFLEQFPQDALEPVLDAVRQHFDVDVQVTKEPGLTGPVPDGHVRVKAERTMLMRSGNTIEADVPLDLFQRFSEDPLRSGADLDQYLCDHGTFTGTIDKQIDNDDLTLHVTAPGHAPITY